MSVSTSTGRIETNRLLVDAIHTAAVKPKAFVTVSGVGYYEPSEKVIYDENWTQPESNGRDYLMNLARDWEKSGELDDQHAPTTRRVIIRAGVVIGKDGGIIGNSKLPFLLGLGGPIGMCCLVLIRKLANCQNIRARTITFD